MTGPGRDRTVRLGRLDAAGRASPCSARAARAVRRHRRRPHRRLRHRGDAVTKYVALGDSYSAGPLIPTTDLAGGCARSDHNYPSLLADELDAKTFVDVTCSGAKTHDITGVQRPFPDARSRPSSRRSRRTPPS